MSYSNNQVSPYLPQIEADKVALVAELKQIGVKHTPENILRIGKLSDGKIVFLEEGKGGDTGSGLKHILEKHLTDFANRGISEKQIPDAIIVAVVFGQIVGYQKPNRPIYQIDYMGRTQLIAITVSNNGYIVCANPASL